MTNQQNNNNQTQNPLQEMEAMFSEIDASLAQSPIASIVPNGPNMAPPNPPEPNTVRQEIKQYVPEELDNDDKINDEFEEFVVNQVHTLTQLVLSNCTEDRDEATATIKMIKDLIASQDRIIHGGTISRLLQAIDTRSSITLTIVKMLETQAKILSARKGPSKQINNTAVTATAANGNNTLISILEAGLRDKRDNAL